MNNTIYSLKTPDDLKKVTNKLMQRSLQWSVLSDAQLKYPCHVIEVNNFAIQSTELREVIKHDGVWRDANTPLKELSKKPATVAVMVVQ